MLDGLCVRWAVDISKGLGATKACVRVSIPRAQGWKLGDSGVKAGLVPGVADRLSGRQIAVKSALRA